MKKAYYLLLSLLLVLALAGCSAKSESTTEKADTAESVQTAEPVAESIPAPTKEPTATPNPTPTLTPEQTVGDLSLKEFFAERNMKVGTCLTAQMIVDKTLNPLILSQFSSVTMENDMKPDATFDKEASKASGEIEIKFNNNALKMLEWAKTNGVALRGHTVVWYSQTPEWIFYNNFEKSEGFASREVMLARLESAMKNTFGLLEELGYADLFYAYDVVNEYWMEDGTMRKNNWYNTIGEDYVWYALYYARKYAPDNIDLYINDYNEQYKRATASGFFKTLVDENGEFLMDGIGLQAHLYTSDDLTSYFNTLDLYSSMGLKLEITELDVCLGAYQKQEYATEENIQKQGRYYYRLFEGIFDRIDAGTLQMDSVTFWGVTDKLSWRAQYNPLLFNKKNYPKYAYYGVLQMKDKAGFETE